MKGPLFNYSGTVETIELLFSAIPKAKQSNAIIQIDSIPPTLPSFSFLR